MQNIKFTPIEKNESFKIMLANGLTNEGMNTHISDKDAYLYVLAGSIQFTLGDGGFLVGPEEGISIPKGVAHSFLVIAPCTVMLTLDIHAQLSFL